MVSDNHQVTDFKIRVRASCSVRYEQGLDAQFTHHTHGESHFLHGVAFIKMKASLHGHDIFVAQFPENQFAAVSFDGGNREVRNLRIVDFILVGDFMHQAAQARAQDDGCFRMSVHLRLQKGGCFLNFF